MRPCACITCELQRATDRIIAYRIYRGWRDDEMAMQLKGLRAKATGFRAVLDDVGKAYDEGANAATLHASDVRGLAAEFKDLKDDLDFAIGTVGNSSAVTGDGEGAEKPKPAPAAEQPKTEATEQAPAPSPPAVGQEASLTFPAAVG